MWHDFCRHIASFEVGPNTSLPQYLDTYVLKTPFLHGHVIHVLKDVITVRRRVYERTYTRYILTTHELWQYQIAVDESNLCGDDR